MIKRNADLRASSEDLKVSGTPIVFEKETVIKSIFGDYKEIIKRGALDNTDMSDVMLLINHDFSDIPLARSKANTMTLNVDNNGLNIEATLPDTEKGKGIYKALKRGDLDGMSFAFDVDNEEYDESTNTRIIRSISKIYEVSIVNMPAYEDTKVEARNKSNIIDPPQKKINNINLTIQRILKGVN